MEGIIGKLFDFDWMAGFAGGLLITAFLVQCVMFVCKQCRKGKALPFQFEWLFAIPLGIFTAWLWSAIDPDLKGAAVMKHVVKDGLINAFSSTGIYTAVVRPLLMKIAPKTVTE